MLVDAAVAGDRTAFETLVLRHGPVLHRYARRMLRTRARSTRSYRTRSSRRGDNCPASEATAVRTWLFAIRSRKVIDSTRVKHAQPVDDKLLQPLADPRAVDPFEFASNAEFVEALEAALAEPSASECIMGVTGNRGAHFSGNRSRSGIESRCCGASIVAPARC